MDLVGAWLRQLLGAGMAAAIVPVAMLAALAVVLVGAGGFGGLGSIGQLIGGPKISPTEEAAAGEPRANEVARVPPPTILAARPPVLAPAQTRAPREQRPGQQPSQQPPRGVLPLVVPPLVVAQPPPPAPPPTPAPPAGRPARRNPVQPVTELLERTVGGVRAVVGKVIDRLGQTVERIIGPPPLLQ